jgi:hypothetical protein
VKSAGGFTLGGKATLWYHSGSSKDLFRKQVKAGRKQREVNHETAIESTRKD